LALAGSLLLLLRCLAGSFLLLAGGLLAAALLALLSFPGRVTEDTCRLRVLLVAEDLG
jgi:hypothetical protein